VVFDVPVNSGPRRALRMLHEAVGVTVDGLVGPMALRAVMVSPAAALIDKLADARRQFNEALTTGDPSQGRLLKGWLNRVAATTSLAQAM